MSKKGKENVSEEVGENVIVQEGMVGDFFNSVNGNRRTEDGEEREATNLDDGVVLYEAELELSALEQSPATARKLTCTGVLVVTIAALLFVFSFPFSLFLVLFCFDTKRSVSPCTSIYSSPWRLYLTKKQLHYHLPIPPRRPYINVFYCLSRVYEISIPLRDIKRVSVQALPPEKESQRAAIVAPTQGNTILIELRDDSEGVKVPVGSSLGLWSRDAAVRTIAIYSVKDGAIFVQKAEELLNNINK